MGALLIALGVIRVVVSANLSTFNWLRCDSSWSGLLLGGCAMLEARPELRRRPSRRLSASPAPLADSARRPGRTTAIVNHLTSRIPLTGSQSCPARFYFITGSRGLMYTSPSSTRMFFMICPRHPLLPLRTSPLALGICRWNFKSWKPDANDQNCACLICVYCSAIPGKEGMEAGDAVGAAIVAMGGRCRRDNIRFCFN